MTIHGQLNAVAVQFIKKKVNQNNPSELELLKHLDHNDMQRTNDNHNNLQKRRAPKDGLEAVELVQKITLANISRVLP